MCHVVTPPGAQSGADAERAWKGRGDPRGLTRQCSPRARQRRVLADEHLPIRYRLLPFRGNLQQVNDARAKREKPPGARWPRTGVDERVNQERDVLSERVMWRA